MFQYKTKQNKGSTEEEEATRSAAGMEHSPIEAVCGTWSDHTAFRKMPFKICIT